jgi:hypothetical protein
MANRFASDRRRYRPAVCGVLLAAGATALLTMPSISADSGAERVRGFFCNNKDDSIAFLSLQAKGENEEMAAYAVNKRIAKFSCAYYLPAKAIPTGEQTVIDGGIVYKLQSYLFLPEKVERWSGTTFGSLAAPSQSRADI